MSRQATRFKGAAGRARCLPVSPIGRDAQSVETAPNRSGDKPYRAANHPSS